MGILILIGVVVIYLILGAIFHWRENLLEKGRKYDKLKPRLDQLDSYALELKKKESEVNDLFGRKSRDLQKREQEMIASINEWQDGKAQRLNEKELEISKLAEDNRDALFKREQEMTESLNKWEEGKNKELKKKENEILLAREAIDTLAQEKSKGFPYLARAYDAFFAIRDNRVAYALETKSHPAQKSSEQLRQISKERREAEKAARMSKYLLEYCKELAPWLDDYIGIEEQDLDDIIKNIHSSWEKKEEEFEEEVKKYYGPKYADLSPTERLQRKLDWYWQKPNKPNWQIGRDYESYVGHLYETKGWSVYYHGVKGFEDLGRDLICKKDGITEVIQCKHWARGKTIHEKNIYYLFGTTIEYYLENFGEGTKQKHLSQFANLLQDRKVIPKLIATVDLSPKAVQVANMLGVAVENTPFAAFPSIKCNVSRRSGEKIYHLPFDQQYCTILIEEEKSECYASTIEEAEKLGFRHAYRWKGEMTGAG